MGEYFFFFGGVLGGLFLWFFCFVFVCCVCVCVCVLGGCHGVQQLDVRSQFPDQGLNLGHHSESNKS